MNAQQETECDKVIRNGVMHDDMKKDRGWRREWQWEKKDGVKERWHNEVWGVWGWGWTCSKVVYWTRTTEWKVQKGKEDMWGAGREAGEAMRRKSTAHQGETEMMEGSQLRPRDGRMETQWQGRAEGGPESDKKLELLCVSCCLKWCHVGACCNVKGHETDQVKYTLPRAQMSMTLKKYRQHGSRRRRRRNEYNVKLVRQGANHRQIRTGCMPGLSDWFTADSPTQTIGSKAWSGPVVSLNLDDIVRASIQDSISVNPLWTSWLIWTTSVLPKMSDNYNPTSVEILA